MQACYYQIKVNQHSFKALIENSQLLDITLFFVLTEFPFKVNPEESCFRYYRLSHHKMAAGDLTLQSQSLGVPTENLPEACPFSQPTCSTMSKLFSWGLCWVSPYTISTEHFEWGRRLNNTSTTPNSDAIAVSENQRKEENYNQTGMQHSTGFLNFIQAEKLKLFWNDAFKSLWR